MKTTQMVLLSIGFLIIVAGSVLLMKQIYRLIFLDAQSRGLEHPRLWSNIVALGGRGEGFFLYFFKRKNYQKIMSEQDCLETERIKRRIFYLMLMDFIAVLFCLAAIFLN